MMLLGLRLSPRQVRAGNESLNFPEVWSVPCSLHLADLACCISREHDCAGASVTIHFDFEMGATHKSQDTTLASSDGFPLPEVGHGATTVQWRHQHSRKDTGAIRFYTMMRIIGEVLLHVISS